MAGKRIICSKRYGKAGCGHTRQLYLADVIPRRQYRLPVVIAFTQRLIDGASLEQAYFDATGCTAKEARHAWRWLKELFKQLALWRTLITKPVETFEVSQRSRRLKVLLPTLERLFNGVSGSSIALFQWQYQRSFF